MSRFLPPVPDTGGPGFYGIIVKDDVTTIITDSIEFKGADFDVTAAGDGAFIELDNPGGGGGGGGFYGVIFKETEAGGAVFKDDQLNVDSNFFYLSSDGSGKPVVSLTGDMPAGSQDSPGWHFVDEKTTGLFRDTANVLSIGINGATPCEISEFQVRSRSGNAGAPGHSFVGATNTGMFNTGGGAQELAFSNAGVERARFTNNGLVIGGTSLDDGSALQIDSTDRGFLPPRMTTAQRDGIATPLDGLIIYNSDNETLQARYNGAWVNLDPNSGFYGINVKHSDDSQSFSGLNTIAFNVNDFYVTQNTPNTDEVIVNYRGQNPPDVNFSTTNMPEMQFVGDTLKFNRNDFYLTSDSHGHPVTNLLHDLDEKSISYRWPSRNSTATWWVPSSDITIKKIHANLLAKDAGFYPSVTWHVHFDPVRSHDGGTKLINDYTRTGGIGFYPGTAAHVITTFDNPNIPKDNYIWFRATDLGEGFGAEEEIHLTMHFSRN